MTNAPVIQLPISTAANDANDSGEPLCIARPKGASKELLAFEQLAKQVSLELLKIQYDSIAGEEFVSFETAEGDFDTSTVRLSLDKGKHGAFLVRLYSSSGAIQKQVSPAFLRSRDPRSGEVIKDSPFLKDLEDEMTNEQNTGMVEVHSSKTKKTNPSLKPSRVTKKGRYGYSVQWEDGATIIYSKMSIAMAAGAEKRRS